MKVIRKTHLFEFSKRYPDCSSLLKAWHNEVKFQEWKDSDDLIKSFPGVTLLDKEEVFFELEPERYYLLACVKYPAQTLSIKGVLRKLLPTQLWKGHLH